MNGENENILPADEGTENERLKKALCDIREHIREIDGILETVADLLEKADKPSDAPASKEEILDLLKKYSRL